MASPGHPSYKTVYTYSPAILSPPIDWYLFPSPLADLFSFIPIESSIVDYDANDSILRTTVKTGVVLPSTETTTIGDPLTGPTIQKTYQYSGWDNISEVDETSFGAGTPGPIIRKTLTSYQAFPPAAFGFSPADRPCKQLIEDGSSNVIAETDTLYDGGTSVCGTPGTPSLVSVSGLPVGSHDETTFGVGSTSARGNQTSVKRTCLQGCASSTTTYSYDETGQVVSMTDGCGNATCSDMTGTNHTTTYSYTDSPSGGNPAGNSNAYLTSVTNPLGQSTKSQYNYATGEMSQSTDANTQSTNYIYSDPLLRLTDVYGPPVNGVQPHTHYSYVDGSAPSITTTDPIGVIQKKIFDGLGHVIQTQLLTDPAGITYADTTYDGLGRVASASNPYRNPPAPGDTPNGVTVYTYDALNRKIVQTQPDNSTLQWCYDGVASSAAQTICAKNASSVANVSWVDSSDETGRHRQQASDGLGRLVSSMEPDPVTNLLALETDYAYDLLNNLLSVNQKGSSGSTARGRGFTYDSLSRLLTSTNPETGTICYGQWNSGKCANGYDANGNLLYKTDNRNITLGYSYDALNRVLSKTYLNDSFGTASSCYQYDTSSVPGTGGNLVGRLTNAWTQKGNCSSQPALNSLATLTRRSMLSYDPMGRLLSEQQCTFANCKTAAPYNPTYDYDLAGNVMHHSNGIGTLTFTNCYNGAGQLSLVLGVSTSCSSPTGLTLFSAPSYTAAGGLSGATYGTGLNLTRTYDSRMRITGETDTGNSVTNPTPGTAKITITGTDHTQ